MKTKVIVLLLFLFRSSILPGQPAEDFDVYLYDFRNKTISQLSNLSAAGEFNPSFSPSGRFVVHDVVVPGAGIHDLYVTSTETGESRPLRDGDGGNDASWSPLEFLIAFDRAPVGDFSIYTVCFFETSPFAGDRKLLREYATDPDWSPTGTRLVFRDLFDGSIKTIGLFDKLETTVVPFGLNPAWSPNGRYIAYGDGNNLFRIAIDHHGQPVSDPIQITFDDPSSTFNFGAAWSPDSRYIVFSSNRNTTNFDFDIWSVEADGGVPTRLAGSLNNGDYDPAFSKNGKFVAYSAFTNPNVLQLQPGAAAVTLMQNYPNPVLNETNIGFELAETNEVTIEIRDHSGKLIRTLTKNVFEKGIHTITWDCTNHNGDKVGPGYYYYSISLPGFKQVRRMFLEK